MRLLRLFATTTALALLGLAPAADAAKPKPRVSWVKCFDGCASGKVERGGTVKLAGRRFTAGSRVVFSVKRGGRRTNRTVRAELTGSSRLVARVPIDALSGRVYVRARGGVRSNAVGPLRIAPPRRDNAPATPAGTAFDGAGMWIWYIARSNGGDPSAIASQALGNNVSTVFVKSGDGTTYWDQFSAEFVRALKDRGLRVCGWQYVYGNDPEGEAAVAARAKDTGADCFVIDAETEYEGKYDQALTYVNALRTAVGRDYPIGLAGFPYVDYHPAYPYSVFLGPGGAQFNVPQAYWKTIGEPVDAVVEHTYVVNRPYGRPIVPIGQTYDQPPLDEIQRFRALVAANGSSGHSWWSWEQTDAPEWAAIGQPLAPFAGPPPSGAFVTVKRGNRGDLVRWAQLHLTAAGFGTTVDGDFGTGTQQQVAAFQTSRALSPSGEVDTATWKELLKAEPSTAKRKPRTAKDHAKRNELR
jgi:hypothetical protein